MHYGKCDGGAVPPQPAMMYFMKAAEREKQSTVYKKTKKQTKKNHITESTAPSTDLFYYM